MLFASKSQGLFIDLSEDGLLLARTQTDVGSLLVHEVAEAPVGDAAAITELLSRFLPKKGSNYLQAVCGVYPSRRLVRRATLEPKRVGEPGYLNEVVSTQFRVDPEQYTLALINAADGLEFDAAKGTKDVLFCGLPAEDVIEVQDKLLADKIYPERVELGTVATLGGLADYLRGEEGGGAATLMLELGMDVTHSFIVTPDGVEASRPIPQGLSAMVPVVQKELGLRDEESARKLFFSNTFDFTGMGPALIKKLLKELQSSIGFYEVQTGQSIGRVICTRLPPKLAWLESSIATQLAVTPLRLDLPRWLAARQIKLGDGVAANALTPRWFSLFCLMANPHAALPEKKA